jgi:hypothetical protein
MNPIFRKPNDDLEQALISQRPEPRRAFVKAVAASLRRTDQRPRAGRIGLVLAFSGLVLIGMASFGGVGYAWSAASQAVHKVETAVHAAKPTAARGPSAAEAEYGPPTFPPPPPTPPPAPPPTQPPGTFTPPPPPPATPPPTPPTSPQPPKAHLKPPAKPPASGHKPGTGQTGSQGAAKGGQLPFTGLSLWIPLLVGAGLVMLGIALRRRARRLPPA